MALITSLLFLLVISMLTISFLDVVILELKITGNFQDKIKSFYMAEDLMQHKLDNIKRSCANDGSCEKISKVIVEANYHGSKVKILVYYEPSRGKLSWRLLKV